MTLLPYELAAKLKDAGWPQPQSKEAVEAMEGDYLVGTEIPYYSPSLSELIAACPAIHMGLGKPFVLFAYSEDGAWCAGYSGVYTKKGGIEGNGTICEEAVANLWLTLKKEGIV